MKKRTSEYFEGIARSEEKVMGPSPIPERARERESLSNFSPPPGILIKLTAKLSFSLGCLKSVRNRKL